MMVDFTESLKDEWMKITEDIDEDIRRKWWDEIRKRYSDEIRKYHTLRHLHNMFQLLHKYSDHVKCFKTIAFAIFFHDLEYDPKIQDNEEKSVELFEDFAKEASIPEDLELHSSVIELINLTKTHSTEEHKQEGAFGREDKHFFLDFDMSILGGSPEDYKEYAKQVREEYDFIPEAVYSSLRAKVLKSFLQIPNIFATEPLRKEFEQQARDNIKEEIVQLES